MNHSLPWAIIVGLAITVFVQGGFLADAIIARRHVEVRYTGLRDSLAQAAQSVTLYRRVVRPDSTVWFVPLEVTR